MIPSMILLGLALGRWWRLALVVAGLGWPALLLATGLLGLETGLLVGSVLAVANAGVGVLVHQSCLAVVRQVAARRSAPPAVEPAPEPGHVP